MSKEDKKMILIHENNQLIMKFVEIINTARENN